LIGCLPLRFGAAAIRMADAGEFDKMVAWNPPHMTSVHLADDN